MMKKWLSRLAAIFAAGMMACSAYAEQATATFSLRPEQGAQGDTVWYELVYDSGSHSTGAAAFYFDLEPGVSVAQVLPGDDVETAEISYNSTGQELVLLYVDEDGGLSAPQQDAQLFRIQLKGKMVDGIKPFILQKTDCATLQDSDVISVQASLEVDPITCSDIAAPAASDEANSTASTQDNQTPPAAHGSIGGVPQTSGSTDAKKPVNSSAQIDTEQVQNSEVQNGQTESISAADSIEAQVNSAIASSQKPEQEENAAEKPSVESWRVVLFAAIVCVVLAVLLVGIFWIQKKDKRR